MSTRNTSRIFSGAGDFAMIIGSTAAPTDETDYDLAENSFGNVAAIDPANESEAQEIFGSYNGVLILDEILNTSHKIKFKLTCDEVGHQAIRAMFGADEGTANTDVEFMDYTPLTGANSMTGFARLRIYDAKDNTDPRVEWKNFKCHVKLSSQPKFDGKYNTFEYEVTVLGNVGTVTVKKDPNLG